MFVQIEVRYEWFGQNTDISFVGPFEDKSIASTWSDEFNTITAVRKVKAKSEVIEGSPTNRVVEPANKTPQAVLSTVLQSISEVCRG